MEVDAIKTEVVTDPRANEALARVCAILRHEKFELDNKRAYFEHAGIDVSGFPTVDRLVVQSLAWGDVNLVIEALIEERARLIYIEEQHGFSLKFDALSPQSKASLIQEAKESFELEG